MKTIFENKQIDKVKESRHYLQFTKNTHGTLPSQAICAIVGKTRGDRESMVVNSDSVMEEWVTPRDDRKSKVEWKDRPSVW